MDEKWFRKMTKTVNFLKLRASYGVEGTDNVQDYQYLSQWSSMVNYNPLLSYAGITPLASQHAVNQDYHWQAMKNLNVGLEAAFFKNAVTFVVDYYQRRCDNQLTSFPTPVFTGWSSVVANWPANVQNTGLEFTLGGRAGRQDGFNWSGQINIGINRNKLLSYPDIEHSPYLSNYIVGKPLNSIPLFHFTGVDPATGKNTYEDYDHNGVIMGDYSVSPGTGADDRRVFFNKDPRFIGGMSHSFHYKDFGLTLQFSFVKQMAQNAFANGSGQGGMRNISVQGYEGRWTHPGQQATFARLTTNYDLTDGYYVGSDAAYTDASYIRLQSMEFSYGLPKSVLDRMHLKAVYAFIQTSNLFTITAYKGLDPALPFFGAMPTPKTIAGGITINF
jgi:hypothetical protein